MKSLWIFLLMIAMSTFVSFGQKGTAEPGYYPMAYSGDTWTGAVTAVNEETREFTLTYKKKDKEETFVGVLQKGYLHKMADGSERTVMVTDLMGIKLRAYYMSKTVKVNDQKVKYNDVFRIRILELPKP